jgi:hypothetical protein
MNATYLPKVISSKSTLFIDARRVLAEGVDAVTLGPDSEVTERFE